MHVESRRTLSIRRADAPNANNRVVQVIPSLLPDDRATDILYHLNVSAHSLRSPSRPTPTSSSSVPTGFDDGCCSLFPPLLVAGIVICSTYDYLLSACRLSDLSSLLYLSGPLIAICILIPMTRGQAEQQFFTWGSGSDEGTGDKKESCTRGKEEKEEENE